ncbi:CopG family transcriptional regulator [Candidatus Bathyarchaeota archaeon]|nr:MAG: CopG family transcriptional regulator [Candidatus Bathyarchaeota archaeon]
MTEYVTVSAKIDVELRKKLRELGIKPSEVIRKALEREVEERTRKLLYEKAERASRIISKVRSEEWVKAIREGREAR